MLRGASRVALVAGALGSLAFMLVAGRSTPRLLLAGFVVWVLSPFVVLAWADVASKRWSVHTRTTLYVMTIAIALGTLAIYDGLVVVRPAGSANAFLYVAVPPVSWLLTAIVVPAAALMSRRR